MLKLVAWSLVQFLKNDRIQVKTVGGDGWGGVGGKAFGNEGVSDLEIKLLDGCSCVPSNQPIYLRVGSTRDKSCIF